MNEFNKILRPENSTDIFDIAIIGGGPAGIMAAISAAKINPKSKIAILEKNNDLGRKLLLTGNGRCNFTTSLVFEDLISSFGKKGKFFFEAFMELSNTDLIDFFKSRKIQPAHEEENKVFPEGGNSHTILNCLKDELAKANIKIYYNFAIIQLIKPDAQNILPDENKIILPGATDFFILSSKLNKRVFSKKVILATGGLSYPQTGSTGDGYKIAESFGHSILRLSPSLIPLVSSYLSSLELEGISLKNIVISAASDNKIVKSSKGDLIFTHFGLSGPAAISLGNTVYNLINAKKKVFGFLDLCPDINIEDLLKNYEKIRSLYTKKEILTTIKILLPFVPNDLTIKLFEILKIDQHQKTGNINKTLIANLLNTFKKFTFVIDGTLSFNEAIVTEGGIPIKEINPRTMESKVVKNLYFAGEIIEIQGPEGGFNLQKAFSTGWFAGRSAALSL